MSIIFDVLGLTSVATVGFFVYKYNNSLDKKSSIKNNALLDEIEDEIDEDKQTLKHLDAKLEALVSKKESLTHKVQCIESVQATLEDKKKDNQEPRPFHECSPYEMSSLELKLFKMGYFDTSQN